MSSSAPNPEPTDQASPTQGVSLYQAHQKIHPRSVQGRFNTLRVFMIWATQLWFYGLCWLPWNGRQAVLFDIAERKFYLFGLVFGPQDVFYLTILLIISAYSLFLFTAVAGRLWCGYTCPQTVYSQMFMWIERWIEGERNARIKLDAAQMDGRKFAKRVIKYTLWVGLALWTGFTFVGYFTPIRSLTQELLTFSLGPWEWFWFLFYAAFTYLLAGHLREQVCLYMCPYARFQGVMFDPDTLVVTYDSERGEPRGPRKKEEDATARGLGHCVDCDLCVAVCPTGIDIRKGLQYECIGCSACIDVCDQVMDKMGYPRGLIRYSTEHAIAQHWGWKEIVRHIFRPRIFLYSAILFLIVAALVWALATKTELRVDVIRDRGVMAREVSGGLIENVYQLQVMNVSETARRYRIQVTGLDRLQLVGDSLIEMPPSSVQAVAVTVRAPPESGREGANTIFFDIASSDGSPRAAVHEKATFFIPKQ